MLEWLDITQIMLLLSACGACYVAGKYKGVSVTIDVLLEKKILKESDLDKI